MLDEFIDSQDIAYSILKNSFLNNKLSHAYLFDANNYVNVRKFVMAFVKAIICDNNYTNVNCCGNCNKCSRIDNNNFLEVKVIESDGIYIKKEQLLELQNDFSFSSIESSKRVYVIYDCDKMTPQAANSLLKFLEEPTDNIIAILVTNNFNKVLKTIISRCQVIRLKKSNVSLYDKAIYNFSVLSGNNDLEEFASDKKNIDNLCAVMSFVNYFEENGLDILIYMNKMWFAYFKDRVNSVLALDLIINIYYDILKTKCSINNLFFNDYKDYINSLAEKNDINFLIRKIDILIETKNLMNCNLNINLLLDKMIISLGGVADECCTS